MVKKDTIDILKKTDMFSSYGEEELSLVAGNSGCLNLKKGEFLFRNNDPSSTLYCVVSGEIAIVKHDENQGETEIARFMDGNCFGELNFLTGSPRNADARCEKDAVLICFPEEGKSFE
ncbi:MAG: Crp/Fnr family transcriptional regulator, partial [Spirochaetota bacterium]